MSKCWKAGLLAAAAFVFSASAGVLAGDATPGEIIYPVTPNWTVITGVQSFAGILVTGNDVTWNGAGSPVTLGAGDAIIPTGDITLNHDDGSNAPIAAVGVLSNKADLVLKMGGNSITVDLKGSAGSIMGGYVYSAATATAQDAFTGSIAVKDVTIGKTAQTGAAAGIAFLTDISTAPKGVAINGNVTAHDIKVTSGAGADAHGIIGGALAAGKTISVNSITVGNFENGSGNTGRAVGLNLEGAVSGAFKSTGDVFVISGNATGGDVGEAIAIWVDGIAKGGSVTVGGDITAYSGEGNIAGPKTLATGIRVNGDLAGSLDVSNGVVKVGVSDNKDHNAKAYGLRVEKNGSGDIVAGASVKLGGLIVSGGVNGGDAYGVSVAGDVAAGTLTLTGNIIVESYDMKSTGLSAGSFADQIIAVDIDASNGLSGYAVETTDTTKNSKITIAGENPMIAGRDGTFNLVGDNDTLIINTAKQFTNGLNNASFIVEGAENIIFKSDANITDAGNFIQFDRAAGANSISVASGKEAAFVGGIWSAGDWNKDGGGVLTLLDLGTDPSNGYARGDININ